MARAKAKRKQQISELFSPEAQRKSERQIRRQLDELDERADERFQYAQQIIEANPDSVQTAVERMVEVMGRMAGPPRFVVEGQVVNVEREILDKIQYKLHTWFAVRLLIACAKWDIRIAGFTAPSNACIDCGKAIGRR